MSCAFSLQQVEALVVRFKHTLLRLRRLTAGQNTEHIIYVMTTTTTTIDKSFPL